MLRSNGRHILTALIIVGVCAGGAEACRFWAAVGQKIPPQAVHEQLKDNEAAFKTLGDKFDDGWSVGYYRDGLPQVMRGADSSSVDPDYDTAVIESAQSQSKVLFAHLRWATTGCVDGVPNPHPFIKERNGKKWSLGHNGTIPKEILINLIGEQYLDENPPQTCTYDPPASWVDSELYLIYLMKFIDLHDGAVQKGIEAALKRLYQGLGEERKALNFFLTDGNTVWAYRRGPTLWVYQQRRPRFAAVSSQPPSQDEAGWTELEDDTLVVLKAGAKPTVKRLFFE